MTATAGDQESIPDFRMEGVTYAKVQFQPPFSVRVPLGEEWRLYLIRGGEVVFEADDEMQTRLRLAPGSVLALSGVLQHRFTGGGPKAGRPPNTPWTEQPLDAETAEGVTVIVGRVPKDRMMFLALFETIVALPADRYPEVVARIGRAIDAIADESQRPGSSSQAIIRRLAEITALEIGRVGRGGAGARERSARQAAADPRILRAIAAFYAAPRKKWSLERLAEVAGMSRTAFAVRYRELIGTTPMKSLRQLRMQLAAEHLSHATNGPLLKTAARQVGYGSDAAFLRAFRREFGATPGQLAGRRKD